jgi:hypothetical protein
MNRPELILLLNGTITLLVGLLSGVPYGLAMGGARSETTERAWRVAHSGLTMGATLLIAAAAALTQMKPGMDVELFVVYSLTASGYGFSVSLPYAAWGNHPSTFWPSHTASSWVVSLGNVAGALGSLLGAAGLLYGAVRLL